MAAWFEIFITIIGCLLLTSSAQNQPVDGATGEDGNTNITAHTYSITHSNSSSDNNSTSTPDKWCPVYVALGGGGFGVVAALVSVCVCLGCCGFGSEGVRGGSCAASWMSCSGPIESGSAYSSLQSAGAAGLSLLPCLCVSGVGAALGAVAGWYAGNYFCYL